MVNDKATVIVEEQVRRSMAEIMHEMQFNLQWEPPEYVILGGNTPPDTIAFGLTMVRVFKSARWN